jgi:peptidyl-prolyl cis-trans isomerase D
MLDSMRKAASGWMAKLLLGLLVVSFAVWGVSSSILTGPTANAVLEVGSARVTPVEFRLAYDRQLRALSEQFGTRLTREQAASVGIDQQVLTQLSAGALLDDVASDMNLGVSDKEIARLTAEDPAFHTSPGTFDRVLFERVLREVGMRPEDYLLNRAQVARRQQVVDSATASMTMPQAFLDALSVHQGETRDVSFLVLPKRLVEPVAEPDEAKLAAYFAENKAEYRFPEFRAVRHVKLEPEDIAAGIDVSEADIRADYDANIARFTTPEQRTIEQLIFTDRAAADAAAAALAGGKTFDQLAAEQNRTLADVLLGTFAKDAMPDKALAESAFALPAAGSTSAVTEGQFGPVILRVTAINPAVIKPFDQAREQVRNEIALNRAAETILDTHDAYEDARAGGDDMKSAAAKLNLQVVETPAVSRAGEDPAGKRIETLPAASDLLRVAFDGDVDTELPPISLGASGFLWVEVASVTPSRDAEIGEVRDRVVSDWKDAEANRLIGERANVLLGELKGGKALSQIATDLALEAETVSSLSRDNSQTSLGSAGVQAAFGGPQGHLTVAPAETDGAQVLISVDKVARPEPDAGRVASEVAPLNEALSDDVLDQLIARLRIDTPVQVNQRVIDQALNF